MPYHPAPVFIYNRRRFEEGNYIPEETERYVRTRRSPGRGVEPGLAIHPQTNCYETRGQGEYTEVALGFLKEAGLGEAKEELLEKDLVAKDLGPELNNRMKEGRGGAESRAPIRHVIYASLRTDKSVILFVALFGSLRLMTASSKAHSPAHILSPALEGHFQK